MEITRETAEFLLDLLNRQQINVGAPDFEALSATVQKAKQELEKVIADTTH